MDAPALDGMNGRIESALAGLRRAEEAATFGGRMSFEAAEQMESLFASILVKEMSRTLPQGFFGEGPGSDVFSGWLETHLGEALGRSGALRIAERIRFDLARGENNAANTEAGQ